MMDYTSISDMINEEDYKKNLRECFKLIDVEISFDRPEFNYNYDQILQQNREALNNMNELLDVEELDEETVKLNILEGLKFAKTAAKWALEVEQEMFDVPESVVVYFDNLSKSYDALIEEYQAA